MKSKDKLNAREEERLQYLWEWGEPLTVNEMSERLEPKGWGNVTVFKTVQSLSPESSPYRVFAVVVGSAGILSFLYALYEIIIDKRLGSDFTGWAVFIYICPLMLVILFAYWKMWGKKS